MSSSVFTASSLFLRTLSRAGITHAFVNWGSDHPALLEELERQRVESGTLETTPTVVTCPNEMVALSAAQGYAQATGRIAAVIVHVDVGTQALAGAVHNVDRSRTPVFIYAGASAFSAHGEHKGTRNEWIMWIQDIPDQTAIVRQYMRHTAQIHSAITVEKTVKRALQIATSEPKGPVYLWARREAMEEEVSSALLDDIQDTKGWPAVEPPALSAFAARTIATALLEAKSPLIITSHLGRSTEAVSALTSLASLLAIPVINSCPSTVNLPFSHSSYTGVTFLSPGSHWEGLKSADVILVIDSDLPWITGNDRPHDNARVFIVDGADPLRVNIGTWHIEAEMICRADAFTALTQLSDTVTASTNEAVDLQARVGERRKLVEATHAKLVEILEQAETATPYALPALDDKSPQYTFSVPTLIGVLRRSIEAMTPSKGENILYLNESISNYPAVWMGLRTEQPGCVLSSGGSSLGWGLGAAVGASLGCRTVGNLGALHTKGRDLIVVIVGDGSFMFGVPSSAYWMARRYETPFLTIVLNNGGWKSPKLSMLGVHPTGHGSAVPGTQLSVGFGPDTPDFSQIAVAASAGWAWGARIGGDAWGESKSSSELLTDLQRTIKDAIRVVSEEKRCAVVDCVLESI
ncbi:hypothetical protein D9619_007473 [Psilocybe cf. subviscida]|uniref:Pyruvate decarboxylase n=1 Tax=Psilocybe cf. subviscida TaxID=2480587 RepID=A0A8H5EWL6_9AGAR|nr:hypothetical protein D9619_007473 [Psilocybe cf. subviscida]